MSIINIDNLKMNEYKDDIVQSLFEVIRIPSVKSEALPNAPFGEGPKAALTWFLAKAEELGFRTGNVDNYAGYAEFGPETLDAPLIAAVCHLDVVPAEEWTDAFEPRFAEDNDTIIGRGSVDDKGPAMAVLYAMKSLMDSYFEPKCRIRLIVGTDEESGSECLEYYSKHAEIPVAAFTADADFPVINGEKGILRVELNWKNNGKRPAEGTDRLYSAKVGNVPNIVPGEAVLKFQKADGSFEEIKTEGSMGHASTPENYKNAIQYALMAAYERSLENNVDDPFLKDFAKILNTEYNGAGLNINFSDEPSGNLTLNVGIFKLSDDQAEFTLDIRYPVTYKLDDVLSGIESAIANTAFELGNYYHSEALYRPAEDPLVQLLMASYNDVTGENETPKSMGGGTYARSLPNTIAFGANFPGNPYLGHAKFEYAKLSEIIQAAEIFRISLQKMDEEYSNK